MKTIIRTYDKNIHGVFIWMGQADFMERNSGGIQDELGQYLSRSKVCGGIRPREKEIESELQRGMGYCLKIRFPKKDPLLCFFIACLIFIFPIIFWTDVDPTDAIEELYPVYEMEGLSMEFDKGMLSVDVKDVDVRMVFKALKERGKIEILNQKILPNRKVTIKFKELKEEEGIKELMRVVGITNYVAIYEKGPKPEESKISRLILIKAAPSGTSVTEVKRKEVEITAPVEKKREGMGKAMDKAQAETIIEAIMPMLEAEGDGKTAKEIMKELMEGETHPIDD